MQTNKKVDLKLSSTEIAWIAGLLEGEGSFGLDDRAKTRYKVSTAPASPFIKISMVDEDVISKLAKMVNKSYFSPSRKTVKNKIVYTLHIGDRATLLYLLPRVLPYLGKRRQERVRVCIDALHAWEIWYATGGRTEMAKQGSLSKKLMVSKSVDMISPDV